MEPDMVTVYWWQPYIYNMKYHIYIPDDNVCEIFSPQGHAERVIEILLLLIPNYFFCFIQLKHIYKSNLLLKTQLQKAM